MLKFVIKLGLADYSHPGLLAFAQTVLSMMTGNTFYVSPVNPTLIELATMVTAFSDAITAWGAEGNRGGTVQHQDVLDTRATLETGLTSLSGYCMNQTVYNKAAFLSGGWEVKKEKVPVGVVGPVIDFHQFISRLVPSGAVKLRWKRPAGAPRGSISVYRILHGLTADINAATQIALVTQTTYTDMEAANRPSNFYWVVPVCVASNGGIADVVCGYPQGPVVG